MTVIRSARRMAAVARQLQQRGKRIGLVPTMGCLHEGHLSLIRAARRRSDVVIATIFVNPLQFGPRDDFARYPRPLRRDLRLARAAGTTLVFAPSIREIYPPGFQSHIDVGLVARRWEGRVRPGHFRGVATIVAMLFELTRPTVAYFGQKDYQQVCVIRRLVADLRVPVKLCICPTVREADGLAMSSRNAYLSADERRRAAALSHGLRAARARIRAGERRAAPVLAAMRAVLRDRKSTRLNSSHGTLSRMPSSA